MQPFHLLECSSLLWIDLYKKKSSLVQGILVSRRSQGQIIIALLYRSDGLETWSRHVWKVEWIYMVGKGVVLIAKFVGGVVGAMFRGLIFLDTQIRKSE